MESSTTWLSLGPRTAPGYRVRRCASAGCVVLRNLGQLREHRGADAVLHPVVRSLGESRPAWKVLRLLGNLLGLTGFDYDNQRSVRDDACRASRWHRLENAVSGTEMVSRRRQRACRAGADVPIYFADGIVRRAMALPERTVIRGHRTPRSPRDPRSLGIAAGQSMRVRQGQGKVVLEAAAPDGSVPPVACAFRRACIDGRSGIHVSARSAWRPDDHDPQPARGVADFGQDDDEQRQDACIYSSS